ncbi:MAG: ligase-associated DNA damage response endonuclease PdeM [Geminicoccales bacterium]
MLDDVLRNTIPSDLAEQTMQFISLKHKKTRFVADRSGALIWPEQRLLVVADLHFEKGSSFAKRGSLIPPYDTRSTLNRLDDALRRWSPERVISLGDGFHDVEASARLADEDRDRLKQLTARYDWAWITGNHDPLPPKDVGGLVLDELEIGGLTFRHLPGLVGSAQEIAGHLHPKASISARGRRVSRPCFVADEHRVLLPAFGSFTGGLHVADPAIAQLFSSDYRAYLLGRDRVHKVARHQIERSLR